MSRPPWDQGLQLERTALAWTRASVALVAFSLVLFKFVARDSMVVALILLVVVVVLGLSLGTLAWRRARRSDDHLVEGRPLPGAILAALLTSMTVLTGLLGLMFVLFGR